MKQMLKVFGYPLYRHLEDPKVSTAIRARLDEIEFDAPGAINTDFNQLPFVGTVVWSIENLPEHSYVMLEEIDCASGSVKTQVKAHVNSPQFPPDIRDHLRRHYGEPFYFFYWP